MTRRGAAVLGLLVIASGLTGCFAQSDARPSAGPTACTDIVSYPELPVADLNARLPVADLDISFLQDEIMVTRPAGCTQGGESDVEIRCEASRGTDEDLSRTVLGASRDALMEAVFEDGAERVVSERVVGYTTDDRSFRYRMLAWEYPSATDATESEVLEKLRECTTDALPEGESIVILRTDDEVHVMAWAEGDEVLVVESMIALDDDGEPIRIAASKSGLLPQAAFDVIHEWWSEGVGTL